MRRLLPISTLLTVLLLSGCGLLGGGGSSSSSERARLVVRNQASQAIFFLYASPCSSDSWGDDRLGDDVIMSNASKSYRLTTGCWDFKAVMEHGDDVIESNVRITSSEWTWTIG